MPLSNPFICLPIHSNHHRFCIMFKIGRVVNLKKQIHIHNELNLSSFRVIRLNHPISLHKISRLYNACYHSNYCTLWTTLNAARITCWAHCRTILYSCNVLKMEKHCITFILYCLPKPDYLTTICFYYYKIWHHQKIYLSFKHSTQIQYKFLGKFMNDSVPLDYINMNVEIITPSTDYHVFKPHQAVKHTRTCSCVKLSDHLKHRIRPRVFHLLNGILSLVSVS